MVNPKSSGVSLKFSKRQLVVCIFLIVLLSLLTLFYVFQIPIREYFFKSKYLEIMNNLNSPDRKAIIRGNLTSSYNFTGLFIWEHSYVKWVPMNQTFPRSSDPVEILTNGKGRCGEFSILYVSACLSLGYEARLLAAVRPDYSELHNFAEVKLNNSWIHVDPTDQEWNQSSMYASWWGQIGKDAQIFAFEVGKCENVTSRYIGT